MAGKIIGGPIGKGSSSSSSNKKPKSTPGSLGKLIGKTLGPLTKAPKAPAKPKTVTQGYSSPNKTRQMFASTSPLGASASVASQGSSLGMTPGGSYSGIAPGQGGAGGGYAGGGGGGGAAPVESTPKPPSIQEWLASDKIWDTEQTQLKNALNRLKAEYGSFSDGSKGDWTGGRLQNAYDVDFNKNLRDLGWDSDSEAWRQNDTLSSYGSAYKNQLEDFASRGMLDSTAYLQALGDMNRGFDDQLGSIRTGRDNYISDLQTQWRDAYAENDASLQRARQDALMRRAAQFNLPF